MASTFFEKKGHEIEINALAGVDIKEYICLLDRKVDIFLCRIQAELM